MTYKELVNSVLDRLREDRVGSVSETDYSRLVGAFVNDAKRVVEDSWPWQELFSVVSIPITAGANTSYDLEDYTTDASEYLRERARVYIDPETSCAMVKVTTTGRERELSVVSQHAEFVERTAQVNNGESGQIDAVFFGTNPSATSGKTRLRMFTLPVVSDTTETIQVYFTNPQNDLTNDSDVLYVPAEPVKQLAYLYCLYERGEELGEFLTLTSKKAEDALADAIMHSSTSLATPRLQVK